MNECKCGTKLTEIVGLYTKQWAGSTHQLKPVLFCEKCFNLEEKRKTKRWNEFMKFKTITIFNCLTEEWQLASDISSQTGIRPQSIGLRLKRIIGAKHYIHGCVVESRVSKRSKGYTGPDKYEYRVVKGI